jgi:hypothetical protein
MILYDDFEWVSAVSGCDTELDWKGQKTDVNLSPPDPNVEYSRK